MLWFLLFEFWIGYWKGRNGGEKSACVEDIFWRISLDWSLDKLHIHFTGSLGRGGRLPIVPDFNLSDSEDQTPLELALCTGQISVASRLLDAGASIEVQTTKGLTLLHKAVRRGDNASALFLLEHGADINNKYVTPVAQMQRISLWPFGPLVKSFLSRYGAWRYCSWRYCTWRYCAWPSVTSRLALLALFLLLIVVWILFKDQGEQDTAATSNPVPSAASGRRAL